MGSSEMTFPPGMKEKIDFMGRRHFWLIIFVPFVFGLPIIGFLRFFYRGPQDETFLFVIFCTLGALVIVYMRWLRGYEIRLCEKIGLMCPYCSQPLFVLDGRSIAVAGRCPECKQAIASNTIW